MAVSTNSARSTAANNGQAVLRLAKGAHRKGAPFALWRALLLGLALLWLLPLAACPLDRADERARVDYVYDGDTLRLSDGRKIRFIGINTPEINHDGGPSEPFARAARKRLQAMLADEVVLLRYGKERKDRYGRLLAHPYLPDGRSLSSLMLQEGLAAAVVVPPNLWHSDCYLGHERKAREAAVGIWSAGGEVIRQSTELRRDDTGFALLHGRVEALLPSRDSLWLELEGKAALRIPRADLHYFADGQLAGLVGQRVEARGWITYRKGKWRMTVRHPNALSRLPQAVPPSD